MHLKYQKLGNALLQVGNNQILEGIGSGSSLSMLGWLLVQAEFKYQSGLLTFVTMQLQAAILFIGSTLSAVSTGIFQN